MAVHILRGLTSVRLACGCSVGIYETYSGETVGVVDARHHGCTHAGHREGRLVTDPGGEAWLGALTHQPSRGDRR